MKCRSVRIFKQINNAYLKHLEANGEFNAVVPGRFSSTRTETAVELFMFEEKGKISNVFVVL